MMLAIFGEFHDGDLERIRAARERVGFQPLTLVPAVPGGGARVLAFRAKPNFLCEYRLVADPADGSPEGMFALDDAMHWALVNARSEYEGVGFAEILSDWFGGEVKEIARRPLDRHENVA